MGKKILISFTAFLLIGVLAACNETEESNTDEEDLVVPVETTHVTEGDLSVEKKVYGRTAPSSITPVMTQMPGEIDVLEVENGDQVEEDDLIAKIKTTAGIQEIKASATGEITKLELEEGDIATESDPLAVIADMKELLVNFSVTSNVQALFEKEKKYDLFIDEQKYEAKITSISSMPDDTGLYPIEALMKNKDNELLPGMVALLTVSETRIEEALILPTEAIVEESDGAYIYIVKDDLAVKEEIDILESQSDKTALEGEVNEGDEVIVNGQLTLSDGSKVDVVEEENQS